MQKFFSSSIPVFLAEIATYTFKISLAWKFCLVAFLMGRIFFSIWGVVIWEMKLMPMWKGRFYFDIEPILFGIPGALIGMWQRWDGIHYQRIVLFGYEDAGLTAFFPLYPMLGRFLSRITGLDPVISLIIVGNIAFLVSLRLLYQIITERFSKELAQEVIFCLIIFPSSIFLYAIYPQSLLLMFVLLSYWMSSKGKWGWAGLAGLCAGLTHPTSMPLTLLLAWRAGNQFFQKNGDRPLVMFVAPFMNLLGATGFIFWRELAGFPSYQKVQMDVGMRTLHNPWEGLSAVFHFILSIRFDLYHYFSWICLFIFFIIIGVSIWGIRKFPVEMSVYQVGFLFLFLSTTVTDNPLLGILRYPLVMFPLFIGIASIGQSKTWRLARFFVFVTLNLVCSAMFFMWKGGLS